MITCEVPDLIMMGSKGLMCSFVRSLIRYTSYTGICWTSSLVTRTRLDIARCAVGLIGLSIRSGKTSVIDSGEEGIWRVRCGGCVDVEGSGGGRGNITESIGGKEKELSMFQLEGSRMHSSSQAVRVGPLSRYGMISIMMVSSGMG